MKKSLSLGLSVLIAVASLGPSVARADSGTCSNPELQSLLKFLHEKQANALERAQDKLDEISQLEPIKKEADRNEALSLVPLGVSMIAGGAAVGGWVLGPELAYLSGGGATGLLVFTPALKFASDLDESLDEVNATAQWIEQTDSKIDVASVVSQVKVAFTKIEMDYDDVTNQYDNLLYKIQKNASPLHFGADDAAFLKTSIKKDQNQYAMLLAKATFADKLTRVLQFALNEKCGQPGQR